MGRTAAAVVCALIATLITSGGAVGLLLTDTDALAIVYDHALVLRPEATAFESVPTGLGPGLEPHLFLDEQGVVIEASSPDEESARVRWNGSAFVAGRPPGTGARMLHDDEGPVELLDHTSIVRDDETAIVLADGTRRRIVVPHPQRVLPAGLHRALLALGEVLDEEETRTYFLDTTTLVLTPGPSIPARTITCAGSDRDGTVLILVGGEVDVPQRQRALAPALLTVLGVLGLVGVGLQCGRGRWPLGGAATGVGVGLALAALFVALALSALRNMSFF